MALKISWKEPEETTITKVEINRSNTIYGSYTVLEEIDATSDGEVKSSTNTWVTTYTDAIGNRNHWYKIRFYDSVSLWSDYSEPITAEELFRLCSVSDVKNTIETVGRWTDDEIFDAITETDDLIYIECGTPLQASISYCEQDSSSVVNDTYYVGEENIYRVDRVFYGTTTKTELYLDDQYKVNNDYGMVKILPVASSGITLDSQCEIEMRYVPKIYHKLSLYRTCKFLLEKVDTMSSGKTSKELEVIEKKLESVERILMHRVGLQISSSVVNYDGIYGVNTRRLTQDIDRNKYIANNNRW